MYFPIFFRALLSDFALQIGIVPEFVLFFDCSEEEMERRLLSRNQVKHVLCVPNGNFHVLSVSSTILCVFYLSSIYLPASFFSCLKGREDDNIETIKKRFKVFMESSLPVIEYYNSKEKVRKVVLVFLRR